jgi:hypothetical protein
LLREINIDSLLKTVKLLDMKSLAGSSAFKVINASNDIKAISMISNNNDSIDFSFDIDVEIDTCYSGDISSHLGKIKIQNSDLLIAAIKDGNNENMQISIDPITKAIDFQGSSILSASCMLNTNMNDFIRINKLIPVAIYLDGNNSGGDYDYIFWFDPSEEFVEKMPSRLRRQLEAEIKALSNSQDICKSSAIAGEDTHFDVWRACSGAIENLNVYPNPANANVNVRYTLNDGQQVSIALHDMYGREIKSLSGNAMQAIGDYNQSFNVEDVESGLYLVVVKTGNGAKAVQRVIIEK